jgi:hypothetical protein
VKQLTPTTTDTAQCRRRVRRPNAVDLAQTYQCACAALSASAAIFQRAMNLREHKKEAQRMSA